MLNFAGALGVSGAVSTQRRQFFLPFAKAKRNQLDLIVIVPLHIQDFLVEVPNLGPSGQRKNGRLRN